MRYVCLCLVSVLLPYFDFAKYFYARKHFFIMVYPPPPPPLEKKNKIKEQVSYYTPTIP